MVKTTVKQIVEGKYIVLTLNLMLGLVLNLVASLPIFNLELLISMDLTACFGAFMYCIWDFWLIWNQLLIFYLELVCMELVAYVNSQLLCFRCKGCNKDNYGTGAAVSSKPNHERPMHCVSAILASRCK